MCLLMSKHRKVFLQCKLWLFYQIRLSKTYIYILLQSIQILGYVEYDTGGNCQQLGATLDKQLWSGFCLPFLSVAS